MAESICFPPETITTLLICCCCCQVASVVSDSVRPHRWQPTRLPCPWDSPGKNTGVGCHFLLQCMQVKSEREVTHSCPTLSDPIECSLPGSSAHGIFQARVLEWVAIAFSRDRNWVSCIGRQILHWLSDQGLQYKIKSVIKKEDSNAEILYLLPRQHSLEQKNNKFRH